MRVKRKVSVFCILIILLWFLYPMTIRSETYGNLTDYVSYDGITGRIWIPKNINKNTGFIWCMPGTGGLKGTFSPYDYVVQGYEHPKHVVFFVDYPDHSGNYIKLHIDDIPKIIEEIKEDYQLVCMSDTNYYYGFSKGSYLYGDIASLDIWDEAILNDGGNVSNITVGRLKRVVVIQGVENHIYEYDQIFKDKGIEYHMEDFRGLSAAHARVNAWGATDKREVFMTSPYYDANMPDPKYGLNWFGGKVYYTKSFEKPYRKDANALTIHIK